jgi:hypothetical protein
MLKLLISGLTALLAASALLAQQPAANKQQLGPQSLHRLHTLIRPHDDEWRHLKVDWLTDVVAARKRAAAEDKPIVICYTGGAGYNEPLGVC